MQKNNVCKFVFPGTGGELIPSRFIQETDSATMGQRVTLKENRMLLVAEGDGCVWIGMDPVPYRPGLLLFAFDKEIFFVEAQSPTRYLYVDFHGDRATALLRRFGIHGKNRSFPGFDGLIPLWGESLSRATDETVDLAAESMLLYTFSRLSGLAFPQSGPVQCMIDYSEGHFTNPELSLTTLAEALGYSPKYLSHCFKSKMGLGYTDYLRSLRIRYAVSLFDHGIDSVKNVALLSGFRDPLYFSSVFKAQVGISPKEYKTRRVRKEEMV